MTSAIVVGAAIVWILGLVATVAVRVVRAFLGVRDLDSVPRLERQWNLGQRVNGRLADVLDVAQVLDEPGCVIDGGKTTEGWGAVRRWEKYDVFHCASLRRLGPAYARQTLAIGR